MGGSSSHPATTSSSPPSGITQLNNSVFELYHPGGDPELEVIFFHGLQLSDYTEAYWKTWRSRDGNVVWPKEWLGPSLKARILSISYDSSARQSSNSGALDMFQIIENLLYDVVSNPNGLGQKCKVILVGHSLGGLIIKQLLIKCINEGNTTDPIGLRLQTFLKNCKGVFYYATPHGGSKLADYADQLKGIIPGAKLNMPILEFLKVLSKDTARINNEFRKRRHTPMLTVTTEAIAESLPTVFGPFTEVVVVEASARQDVDKHYTVRANHVDVCKPEDQISNIYENLRSFCKN